VSESSGTICIRQHPEEAVETARTRHDQEPADPLHHAPVTMWHSTRKRKKGARADVEPIGATLEHVLTFQDLEELVFMLVDVQRRVQQRRQLFPHGERSGRSLDQNCAASERETFAALRLNGKAMSSAHSAIRYKTAPLTPSRVMHARFARVFADCATGRQRPMGQLVTKYAFDLRAAVMRYSPCAFGVVRYEHAYSGRAVVPARAVNALLKGPDTQSMMNAFCVSLK
jgi:hypothetical protein